MANNMYATVNGCKDKLGPFNIPEEWWSRKFEYPWAAQYVSSGDTVIDAGCGIPHFFKYYLAQKCTNGKVYGVDKDTRLRRAKHEYPNLELLVADLAAMPLPDKCADKITCISVIEHMPPATRQSMLKEFARLLNDDDSSRLIITIDIPTVSPQGWMKTVKDSTFEFDGAVSWDESNALVEPIKHVKQTGAKQQRKAWCCILKKG